MDFLFIRSILSTDTSRSSQTDEIRNIKGADSLAWYGEHQGIINNNDDRKIGAFKSTGYYKTPENIMITGGTYYESSSGINIGVGFDANSDPAVNPMGGHANGSDIHPANLPMVPLISYA